MGANGELSTLINTVRVEQEGGNNDFSFEVEGNHNYFILAKEYDYGQTCVLVHNVCPGTGDGARQQKVTKAKKTAKEKKNDIPSWTEGNRPFIDENGKDFAKRLCDEKYGPGNYSKGAGTEYSKIRKWGDSGFENPPDAPPSPKPKR